MIKKQMIERLTSVQQELRELDKRLQPSPCPCHICLAIESANKDRIKQILEALAPIHA